MRYRPFGVSGKAVSAVSLAMSEVYRSQPAAQWRNLAIAALESGVNAFEVTDGSPQAADGLRQALESLERRLVFLAWRVPGDGRSPLDARRLQQCVRDSLQQTGGAYLDLLVVDEAAYATMSSEASRLLEDLRRSDLVLAAAIAGSGAVVDQALAEGRFDALVSPYNLTTGWATRRRIREASLANIAVIGAEAFPPALCTQPAQSPAKSGLFRRPGPSAATAGPYGFLHDTRGWEADELCLAYAMTEPALATIQIEANRPEVIERLALIPDRELPTGLAAQIEMARIDSENPTPRG
jgi:aryl-alcohol dehydrogenase-like predicted oxidoreductase